MSSLRLALRAATALLATSVGLAPAAARAEREIVIDVAHEDGRSLHHVEQTMPAAALQLWFVARGVRYSLTLDALWQTVRLWRGREQVTRVEIDPAGSACAMSFDPASRLRLVVTFRPEGARGPSTCAARWLGRRAGLLGGLAGGSSRR